MEPFVLQGAGLRLDQVTDADIAAIAEYCQDPVFEHYMTLPWPYSRGDAQYFVNEHVRRGWRDGNEFTWAIRRGLGQELLGVIGFRTARNDLGFWLGSPHRGAGIMPAAVRLVATKLFAHGITAEIAWECVVGNAASLAVARKSGMTYTGTGPAQVEARDGTHPLSWHAVLRADDPPTPKPGWPGSAALDRLGQERPAPSVMLLDLDDTLFAHRAAVDAGILQYRALLGGAYSDGDDRTAVQRWYQLEESQYHRYLAGELSYAGQRRERAKLFAQGYGVLLEDQEADAWFEAYAHEYVRAWRLHDDALPCLDALSAGGIRLGIITNGDLDFQTDKIARLDLSARFEHVITSGELGITKPDARIFEHACSVFGTTPTDAAYVGDRLRTDAMGAAAAGLTGVWLDRARAATTVELEAAHDAGVPVIHTLAELPTAVGLHS